MFSIHFRLVATISNFSHPLSLNNINTGPIVKLDPENIGVAVGISLLSCIETELLVVLYSLPVVYGRHIEFLTSTSTKQY